MKLISTCPNCQEEIKIPSFWIADRIDLAKAKGKEFDVSCKRCNKITKIHVDDVKAVADKTVAITGLIAFFPALTASYFLFQYGFIAYATIALPVIASSSARHNQRTKINQFNLLHYDSKRNRR
ncbi:hypothetical protein [Carboxylicivirga sp. RSCT41]|uniref:hypothetical protein n=1 Tax=Carboxylicivirga agarovorans TaxID=3417570 RepID=UPI003D32BBD9